MPKSKEDPEKEAQIKEEMDRQEAERKSEREEQKRIFDEQSKQVSEARERAAKAEGAVEAMRVFQQSQTTGTKVWGEEEWKKFEEETGFTKAGITAIDNALGSKIRDVETKFEERTRKAEERAKAAEDKYSVYEGKRAFEGQVKEYLGKKPQFARYENEFNEFLSDYPEETRKDPTKLAKLFDKAEIYIKGKLGDKEMRKTSGGSPRFGSDGSEEIEDTDSMDLSGLRPHERATVERLAITKENKELLKTHRHDLKGENGVMIDARKEWDKYDKK